MKGLGRCHGRLESHSPCRRSVRLGRRCAGRRRVSWVTPGVPRGTVRYTLGPCWLGSPATARELIDAVDVVVVASPAVHRRAQFAASARRGQRLRRLADRYARGDGFSAACAIEPARARGRCNTLHGRVTGCCSTSPYDHLRCGDVVVHCKRIWVPAGGPFARDACQRQSTRFTRCSVARTRASMSASFGSGRR